jgi:hypothetical protein
MMLLTLLLALLGAVLAADNRDFYKILGIPRGANEAAIKKA